MGSNNLASGRRSSSEPKARTMPPPAPPFPQGQIKRAATSRLDSRAVQASTAPDYPKAVREPCADRAGKLLPLSQDRCSVCTVELHGNDDERRFLNDLIREDLGVWAELGPVLETRGCPRHGHVQ